MSKEIKTQKKAWTNVLGPVENLESYVKADWWKDLFNANYLKTDGDVVEDESITQNEVDLFINTMAPSQESHILDLCCGQGRHSLELAKRGFTNITGFDRSHYLISRARALNKKQNSNVIFKEGDARKLPFSPDTFDYVMLAGNSFGYFELEQDDLRVLNEILRVLKPQGKLWIDVTDGSYIKTHFQARSWEWIDKNYFVCRERTLSENQDRLISREVISHVKKGVIADQFYAERLYTQERLSTLLEQAQYKDITFHTNFRTESQRNQDLGMMAKRFIVSAITQKQWTPLRKKSLIKKKIGVLLGDPSKIDVIKPTETFDEDDFFTINELKRALESLEEYHFVYIDRHDTLLNKLQRSKDKLSFILNLCDEGFNNEASKELHIPALLEMLNIPYSGGTPQCLAYCYDKSLVRGIAQEMDIPTPMAFIIKPEDTTFIEFPLDFPVIVKPNFGDSSFGITEKNVCFDLPSLENAILQVREQFGYNNPILVEQFLTGKDISLGIIGNPPESYEVLPIIEEDYSVLPDNLPKICGYEAKWLSSSPYWQIKSIPAHLPNETEEFLISSCIKLFQRLNCQDYARFDWRLDDNETPRLLEVNPNPGWCWDGHLAKMSKLRGISYTPIVRTVFRLY